MILEKEISGKLSENEKSVLTFLKSYQGSYLSLSVKEISEKIYVSGSTVIRFAKKYGYDGWNSMRTDLEKERHFLAVKDSDINFNYPFQPSDSQKSVCHTIASLSRQTLKETEVLIDPDTLAKATEALTSGGQIFVFAMSTAASTAYEFQNLMRYLFKNVILITNRDDIAFYMHNIKENDCAIFISHSGQTFQTLRVTYQIASLPCHRISITSRQKNPLLPVTDIHFYIPENEERYAKIGHFQSNESIRFILNTLYACVFHKDYQTNLKKREAYIREVDVPLNRK